MKCNKCDIEMVEGVGLRERYTSGIPDFPGQAKDDRGQTMYPSGQSNIDGILLPASYWGGSTTQLSTLDSWTTITKEITMTNLFALFQATDGGATTFQDAGGDDVFYIRAMMSTQIGEVAKYKASDMTTTTWYDCTENDNDGVVTGATLINACGYWHEYELGAASGDPGASGATYVDPGANTMGGWQLDADTEKLDFQFHIEEVWDGNSDIRIEAYWQVNEVAAGDGTVDIRVQLFYAGDHEVGTRTQVIEVAHTVTGNKAQFTRHKTVFIIPWDTGGNVILAGDVFGMVINLETDTSEVDDIIVSYFEVKYQTSQPAPRT